MAENGDRFIFSSENKSLPFLLQEVARARQRETEDDRVRDERFE